MGELQTPQKQNKIPMPEKNERTPKLIPVIFYMKKDTEIEGYVVVDKPNQDYITVEYKYKGHLQKKKILRNNMSWNDMERRWEQEKYWETISKTSTKFLSSMAQTQVAGSQSLNTCRVTIPQANVSSISQARICTKGSEYKNPDIVIDDKSFSKVQHSDEKKHDL